MDTEKLVPAIKRYAGARSIVLIDLYTIDTIDNWDKARKIKRAIKTAKEEHRTIFVKFDTETMRANV